MTGTIITEVKDSINFADVIDTKSSVPVVALADDIVLPLLPQSIEPADEKVTGTLRKASETHKTIFCLHAPEGMIPDDYIGRAGAVCKVIKVLTTPSGGTTAFLLPGPPAYLTKITRRSPVVRGMFELKEVVEKITSAKMRASFDLLKDSFEQLMVRFNENSKDCLANLADMEVPSMAFSFMLSQSPLPLEEKQNVLNAPDFESACIMLNRYLEKAFELMSLKADLHKATHEEISRQQREHFLRQQMQTIQNELGDNVEDADDIELRERAEKMLWPEYARKHFDKELRKLERYNVQNPEYSIQYNYLDTLLTLPWDKVTDDNFSIKSLEEVLDRDHFGMEKVKERILEHVSVLKQRSDMRAPILCLYGPPGVGKTSLGKSIAEALGREYARVALGGLHDEAEIRGHRRTYIGALPGRIISAMKKCGSSNPVFVLDEIDKVGKDFKGDPSTALLEALDPEQNSHFHDNYLDVDYDLSRVLFIATANDLSGISRPLLDRMELVELSGYATEEKEQIALRHLVKRSLEDHGFAPDAIRFTPDGIRALIEGHTRESGVRGLDKAISSVLRKVAKMKVSLEDYPDVIDATEVDRLLGKPRFQRETYEGNEIPGVVTGLAWTQAGGEILFIETLLSRGKKQELTLTGNLGDVMKESAIIALKYLKAHASEIGIEPNAFDEKDIHIHVPEGAIPKDGPSAGITMLTSLASAFSGRKVRERLAMTGEITLRGKLTPVGGIKEKLLAARRAGITDVVLSEDNRRDVEEIEKEYLDGLTPHYFSRIMDALEYALLP